MHTELWWENLRDRDHLEGLGVDGKTSRRNLRRKEGRRLGCCECGNGPSVSKKPAEFLDCQRTAVGACAARFQLDEEFVAICLSVCKSLLKRLN